MCTVSGLKWMPSRELYRIELIYSSEEIVLEGSLGFGLLAHAGTREPVLVQD